MKNRVFAVMLSLIISILSYAQSTIIPAPVSYIPGLGQFVLNAQTSLLVGAADQQSLQPLAGWFQDRLRQSGVSLQQNEVETVSGHIRLSLLNPVRADLGKEGYLLEVTPQGVQMSANQPAGIFYAMQSFFQLLPPDFEARSAAKGSYTLPACTVTDYPRFGWRGLMLDVSRHFYTREEVKRYIDLMAQYKLNVLHWHLTDDQGWRIEIKSLPKLTEVGACRVPRYGTFGERIPPKPGEAATDCGFYTQEDVKDIVAYAARLNVTIVPEIDVPDHSLAAIAAYPELSVTQAPQMVSPGHKFSEWYGNGSFKMLLDNTLNPSDEKVYAFLDKVFGEVAALFPGKYIHAGGDECYHGYWEKSPQVQQFMKTKNIKDMHGLQSYFMTRVGSIIQSKGKTMIGWDEILDGGLAPGAAVMSWRGMKGGIAAAKMGHEVVMSPTTHAYLDYMQGDPSIETRIYEKLYLKTCYDFEPVPDEVDARLILGGQGNLWTEKVPNYRHATYMTYPRAWALAEVFWSPKSTRNWISFVQRAEAHFSRADAADVKVSKALYDAIVKTTVSGNQMTVTLSCEHPGAAIYYSIDGSFPDDHSPMYSGPITIPEGPVTLKVNTYIGGKEKGRLISLTREELAKRK